MMTRRQRLTAALRGEPVDRVPVSFYEIGGWNVLAACDDDDPFNVYNNPSWRPLAELAEHRTDVIRMIGPRWRQSKGGAAAPDDSGIGSRTTRTWLEGDSRFTCTTLKLADRELTAVTRRDAATNTVWTIEHLLKSVEDLQAYLELPGAAWAGEVDADAMAAEEEALGEAGIVMVEMGDPICEAADLFSMADYTVVAMTESALFHRLLERIARVRHAQAEAVAQAFPGRLWRICGSEYASEPYLPPALYAEYVARYTGPMVQAVQAHGGIARLHSHGRLRGILPHVMTMGCGALDPCEPPPQGDMELADIRRAVGDEMALFGNIESTDIENLAPDAFEPKVRQALAEGPARPEAPRFVLMPSACPYGRHIAPHVLANYETMVRLAERGDV